MTSAKAPSGEHRGFSRVPVEFQIVLRPVAPAAAVSGTVGNVSMNGVYVRTTERLPIGTACQVLITSSDPSVSLCLDARGHVVRHDDGGLALMFDDVELDSYEHLRRLVMLNAEQPQVVERELRRSSGIFPIVPNK